MPSLPPRRDSRRSPIVHAKASDHGEEITCRLSSLEPFSLVIADTDDDRALWRKLVDCHHCPGCPRPSAGSSADAKSRKPACLLMEAGTATSSGGAELPFPDPAWIRVRNPTSGSLPWSHPDWPVNGKGFTNVGQEHPCHATR